MLAQLDLLLLTAEEVSLREQRNCGTYRNRVEGKGKLKVALRNLRTVRYVDYEYKLCTDFVLCTDSDQTSTVL